MDERGRRPAASTWDEVLIVAPYNAQVGAIRRLLPAEARVGTVDKFQGQEAPISIYSLTTSQPELAPRGMDFLYSRHRLNVATSRARCVADRRRRRPTCFRVRARTPEQMRLANAFCRFVEFARRPWLTADASIPLYAPQRARRTSATTLARVSLMAGVALGSTGHIAAVTVATIVAKDLAGSDDPGAAPRARPSSWAPRSGRRCCRG